MYKIIIPVTTGKDLIQVSYQAVVPKTRIWIKNEQIKGFLIGFMTKCIVEKKI